VAAIIRYDRGLASSGWGLNVDAFSEQVVAA
jgi:hypothetical protein